MKIANPIIRYMSEEKGGHSNDKKRKDTGYSSLLLSFSMVISFIIGTLLVLLKGNTLIVISGILSAISIALSYISFSLITKYKKLYVRIIFSVIYGLTLSFISVFFYSMISYSANKTSGMEEYKYALFWVNATIVISILISDVMEYFKLFRVRHFYFNYGFRCALAMILVSFIDILWAKHLSYSIEKSLIVCIIMIFYTMFMATLYRNALDRIEDGLSPETYQLMDIVTKTISVFMVVESIYQLIKPKSE